MKLQSLFFIVALLCTCFSSISQSSRPVQIDSLLSVWKDTSQPDTVRLKAVHTIAQEGFRFKNPDSAFYYGQLQYDFAKTIKNKESQVRALNVQGDAYLLKGDSDKALDILTSALKISETVDDKKLKTATLGNLARVYGVKGNFEKALEYNLQILKISEEIQDKQGIGKSLSNIGESYVRKGDLKIGLEYIVRSKKIFERLGDEYSVIKMQSSMANVYMQQGNPKEALELITLNLAYFEKIGNKTLAAGCLSNLAGIYVNQGNTTKALEYLERATAYFEETGNKPYIARLSVNIGLLYIEEGNLERALAYTKKSILLNTELKNKDNVANAKNSMAIILARQGKHAQAISYANEALDFFQETTDLRSIRNSSGNLANSYKAIGNYKKALEMNELHFQMRDSLNSEKNQKAIIELKVQSDYEKQKAIDDIENEKEIAIQTAKTQAQRNISWSIGGGLLLISILAFVIFNRLKVTRKQKATIEAQKKKVEQSEKYKEQFLANMSHEIRTPMHAISGMTKILQRNDHPSSQNAYLHAMQTSSENLVVILNDVLDLSKIEAGKLEIESIPTNPRLVIENVIQILKFKAEEKGLTISHHIEENVPNLVIGDPTRLNQVLVNLVGNAIKFTEKGAVTLALNVENDQLHFQVTDTGIGIAQSQQEHVFGAFEQAKDSTTRNYGGTGLGLSISKQLVELQKGSIQIESKEGKGSTFHVLLPLKVAEIDSLGTHLISEEKLKAMAVSLQGIRILIAEDNPFNQMIAQDDLSYYINDITIDTVENGALAVEKFNTNTYDLILMDVQMPKMNGFEATKKIRAIEQQENRNDTIPVIAMTASLLKTEIDQCFNAGMDNYIPKPYTIEELIGPIFKELRS